MWLIRFKYEIMNEAFQVYESKVEYQIVESETFKDACELIRKKYQKAYDFENLTIKKFN